MNESISAKDLQSFAGRFQQDKANQVAMNAVASCGIQASARQFSAVRSDLRQYSVNLPQNDITFQKNSGRCWMFAGFNILRAKVIKDLNLEKFTLSGNYLTFYDRLEKANLLLEGTLETLDLPLDSREIEQIYRAVRTDGGEWEMFVSLVNKYGVVPAEVQPETVSTNESRSMPSAAMDKLREFMRDLRRAHEAGKGLEELRAMKDAMLETMYRIYSICYGEPVKTFDFQVRTKDDKFICDRGITPKQFYDKYVGVNLNDYISLVCGSSGGGKLGKYEFQMPYLGNVVGGCPIAYVSVPAGTLKQVAIAHMQAGEPVWFGCDVGEMSWRDGGLMDEKLFDYEVLFDTSFDMERKDRFQYHQADMSHAMVLKGVDLDEAGAPLRWRVENTWGPDVGEKGMFLMTDGWFDKYTYQIVANRKFIPQEILDCFDKTEAVKLYPWTPHI